MRDITKHPEYFNIDFRFPNEVFKIYDVKNKNKVSNYGRVLTTKKILKPYFNRDGYIYFVRWMVHVLVLETFDCLRPDNKCCNHKDGNKHNNHISNLEWVTWSENMKHAWDNGLTKGGSKLKPYQVKFIRIAIKNKLYRQTELAEMYNVHPCTIGDIVHYRNWKNV